MKVILTSFPINIPVDNDFPLFLKTIDLTAYEEGWALYCEQLGEYNNPLSYYGKLNMEMERAIRLVVDTLNTLLWLEF